MRVQAILLAAGLAFASVVRAHSDEYFDSIRTPHGGQMRMAGPFHLEMVVKGGGITVYVADHGNEAIPTDGAKAVARVSSGKDVVEVPLAPAGGNVLKGSGAFKATRSTRVEMSIEVPGKGSAEASFQPVRKTRK
jgi:hypothetical protein